MENTIRVIITLFFIGLIALAVIFFGVFGILPLTKIGSLKNNSTSTETVPQTTIPVQTPSSGNGQVIGGGQVQQPPQNGGEIIPPTPPRVVRLDVPPGSPNAPRQSDPLQAEQIPPGALQVIIKNNAFSPASFAVKSGDVVTIYFTSSDGRSHSIGFQDPSVQGIAVGVGPGETRSISFKTPKAETYAFQCNVPGHAGAGERGTMVVE